MRTFGVIVFPGSNCDHDAYHAAKHVMGQEARFIWHKEEALGDDVDVVIVPGGFSYGDYLRAGAVAQFSPIMKDVMRFAEEGGLVVGICNGFQVLCECGLLPGALARNERLRFVCKETPLRTERTDTPFTNALAPGQIIHVPVAHGEGNYYADEETLDRLEANDQVLFRYSDAAGNVTPEANPNGSARNIAGIISEDGNVCGIMPHPERCVESIVGSGEGRLVFESVLNHFGEHAAQVA